MRIDVNVLSTSNVVVKSFLRDLLYKYGKVSDVCHAYVKSWILNEDEEVSIPVTDLAPFLTPVEGEWCFERNYDDYVAYKYDSQCSPTSCVALNPLTLELEKQGLLREVVEMCNKPQCIGKDNSNQEIVPVSKTRLLEVKTNRHTTCSGSEWGWIEGCTLNICWSDDKPFNKKKARELVNKWNESVKESSDV